MQYLATPPARGCRLPPFLINLSCFKKGQREKKRISVWNDNVCNVRDRRTLVWPFWQQLLLEGLSVEVFFPGFMFKVGFVVGGFCYLHTRRSVPRL